MPTPKQGLAGLIRQAGQDAKKEAVKARAGGLGGSDGPGGRITSADNVFSILDYIESDWGLHMTLYPAQRFLVKLYYFLELDDTLPAEEHKRIQVRDVLTGALRYTFTEKEYLHYLFNEGRCNIGSQDRERRELILAIGRRAGKCVTGDTLVLTGQGILRIEDVAEAPPEGFTPLSGLVVVQEGARRSVATHFYNGGQKPIHRLKTRSGYGVAGTANHRVKVMTTEGAIDWRYLDDVRVGDYLALSRTTDLWASDYLDVRPYHNQDGHKDVKLPDVLDERWGNLLGYLVGDGSWTCPRSVGVTVEHHETWEHLKTTFTDLLGGYHVNSDKRTENTGAVRCSGVRVRRFLHSLGWNYDCTAFDKSIPWAILRSPRSVVCAFLRGLFEADGSAEGGGRNITFCSASAELVRQLQVTLLNLGIVSNVSAKWNSQTKRYYSTLLIKGVRSRRRFAEYIGFDSHKKRDPMLRALEECQEGKSATDSIPHQLRRVRDLLECVPRNNGARGEPGWSRTKLRVAFGNVCKPGSGEDLSYTRLQTCIAVAEELGVAGAELDHFRELARLDYFFDPVVSKEEAEEQVYDLTVPDGVSFVGNGVVNHNTSLSAIFASYEVYRLLNLNNPQAYYGLPDGNRIQIISVATDKDQAGILFNEVAGHLAKCDYFRPYQANNTQSQVNFRTPFDIEKYGSVYRDNGKFASFNGKASVRLTFKGATGKGLRGAGNIVIILDEFAHFLDNKGTASAEEIYKAVTPSAAAFSPKDPSNPMIPVGTKESRIICISSPLGKSGRFFELFDQAMHGGKGSENMLAVQAPTWEINPTVPLQDLQQAYYADATAFAVEYGAQFSDQMAGWIEREEDLQACIEPGLRPLLRGRPRRPHQMGIDVGLVNDGTFICITHIEDGRIVLDYHEGWRAGEDWRETNPHLLGQYSMDYAKRLKDVARLDFDEIANWVENLTKRFHVSKGLFDRWNGIPLEQALTKKGLKQFTSEHFTRDQTSKMYQTVKSMIWNRTLLLYDYPLPKHSSEVGAARHSGPIEELLSLRAKPVAKNIVIVEAPKKVGAHDDFSDAYVRAIWLAYLEMTDEKFVSHGYWEFRPHAASAASMTNFRALRARQHGVPPRTVPKMGRGLQRFVR